jgi:hypothetical protein
MGTFVMYMHSMHNVVDIFAIWPADAELGRDIGVPYPTVSAWKQRGSIPAAYWRDIVQAARKRGHPEVTADLLVDLHARKSGNGTQGFSEEGTKWTRQGMSSPDSKEDAPRDDGRFSRFRHLRTDRFQSLEAINDHVAALREEWDRR